MFDKNYIEQNMPLRYILINVSDIFQILKLIIRSVALSADYLCILSTAGKV